MLDPLPPTLSALRHWVEESGDPSATMEELGLLLHSQVERAGYRCTPAHAVTFAGTGGDGVHFSLLDLGAGISDSSPVVMTVPMAAKPNWILGDGLRDFLSLGLGTGFFTLEQLAYQADWPSHIEAASEAPLSVVMQSLADRLALRPWTNVADRLGSLEARFARFLIVADTPTGKPEPPW